MKPFLEISVMSHCIHKCSYCPQNKIIESYKYNEIYLSLENFKTAILKLNTPSVISFAGFSEPSSNHEILKMVRFAYEQGHELMFLSTLYCFSKEQYNELKEFPWSHFSVHICDDQNKSDIIITDEYIELIEHIVANPIDGMIFNHHAGNVHPSIAHIIPYSHPLIINDRGANLQHEDIKPTYAHGNISCGHRFLNGNSGILLPNGDIQLCCSDWNLGHKLGNLFEQDWDELMESKVISELREKNQNGEDSICRKCWFAK